MEYSSFLVLSKILGSHMIFAESPYLPRRALVLHVIRMLNYIRYPFSRMGIDTKSGPGLFPSLPYGVVMGTTRSLFVLSCRLVIGTRFRNPPWLMFRKYCSENIALDFFVSRPMWVSLSSLGGAHRATRHLEPILPSLLTSGYVHYVLRDARRA